MKIFNQTYRVVCRDNLVIDQPESNGIWYDVGNHDGVFINNWVEGCVDGFFFEISKGAICAGNVFVNCDKGIRVLNSTNVAVYHNTLFNTVASFERTERSAVSDNFGWHPSTGPGVDQREGPSLSAIYWSRTKIFTSRFYDSSKPKSCADNSRAQWSHGSTEMSMCAAATTMNRVCSCGVRSKVRIA